MIIGARQLGVELLRVEDGAPVLDFDKDVVRRLWDNYYVPYVNGYFASMGKFRSDDVKQGYPGLHRFFRIFYVLPGSGSNR